MGLNEGIEIAEKVLPTRYENIAAELARMPAHRWAAFIVTRSRHTGMPPELDLAVGVFAKAYVNHGRWVVDCPISECGGAQLAAITDRRFLCHECLNVAWQGQPVTVIWPPEPKREQVEDLLLRRLFPGTRNWKPPEKLARLEAENAKHEQMVGG